MRAIWSSPRDHAAEAAAAAPVLRATLLSRTIEL
jgi:hypothetical protein